MISDEQNIFKQGLFVFDLIEQKQRIFISFVFKLITKITTHQHTYNYE